MKVTNHANKRMRQRGIKDDTLLLVYMFGEEVTSDSEVVKMQMTERKRRNLIQSLDKCRNKVIVADKNYKSLITTYTLLR